MNTDLTKEHYIGMGGSLADSYCSCDNGGNRREDLTVRDPDIR